MCKSRWWTFRWYTWSTFSNWFCISHATYYSIVIISWVECLSNWKKNHKWWLEINLYNITWEHGRASERTKHFFIDQVLHLARCPGSRCQLPSGFPVNCRVQAHALGQCKSSISSSACGRRMAVEGSNIYISARQIHSSRVTVLWNRSHHLHEHSSSIQHSQ